MICVGTSVQSSREAIEFCAAHAQCYPVVGIHPHDTATSDPAEIRALVQAHRDQIVGIGEIGLDYFYDNSPREAQAEGLSRHIVAARRTGLPLVIHSREADDDMARTLEEATAKDGPFPALLHCYTGGLDLAQR